MCISNKNLRHAGNAPEAFKSQPILKYNFAMLFSRIVDALHDLGGDNCVIDMRRQLFTGADAADKGINFSLEMVAGSIFGCRGKQRAIL